MSGKRVFIVRATTEALDDFVGTGVLDGPPSIPLKRLINGRFVVFGTRTVGDAGPYSSYP